jgi:hypothetical protein
MKTRKAAKHSGSLGGKVRSPTKTKVARRKGKLGSGPKGKKRKRISFQARSDEIHDSLDDAIRKLEAGDLNPESAKAILEKIKIVQTLLRAATRELEDWLKK